MSEQTKKRKRLFRLTDTERRVLAQPAFIAGSVFAVTLLLVITGLINPLDTALSIDIWREERWLDRLFLILESPGQRRLVYPLAILGGLLFTIRRKDMLPLIVSLSALLFTNAMTGVFKIATMRGFPRYAGPEAFNQKFGDIVDLGAFPSGHAANVAAACTLLIMAAYSARPRWRPYAAHITALAFIPIILVTLSGWIRNTHWISDLVGGYALGISTTIVATLWALHLPDHWRHPDMVGKSKLVIGITGIVTFAVIFMFAGNSFLSHAGTSALLVIGTVGVIAYQSHKTYQRSLKKSK